MYYKQLPLIALALAITFSVYSVIKKKLNQPALLSLVYEKMVFAPFSLGIIIYMEYKGIGALNVISGPQQYVLLLLCGLMTVIPLGLFAAAITEYR